MPDESDKLVIDLTPTLQQQVAAQQFELSGRQEEIIEE